MNTEARHFFDEHGYYLARGVFTRQEIHRLEVEFDRIVAQITSGTAPYAGPNAGEDHGIISTTNVQKYSSLWLTHGLLHPPFLDMAENFIGPDIVLQRSSLYEKRKSQAEGPFHMHQDWLYGPVRHDTMVSGMIHVRRATADMGALRIYPGTHKTRLADAWASDAGADFHAQFPLEDATIMEAEAGDVLFFHYCLVHGSMSNQTDAPRKVVHARMFSGEDYSENEQSSFEYLVLRGWHAHANVRITA